MRYFSKEEFLESMMSQGFLVGRILKNVQRLGRMPLKERQLEYFFYTNSLIKATELAQEMGKLNYSVFYDETPYQPVQYLITGLTCFMPFNGNVVTQWAQEMCRIGYRCDCQFDGWEILLDPD